MSSLGVVAISYNEEVDLAGFIDHLLPWVDEIVIVDDGSTDATANIARGYGDAVVFVESPRSEGEYFSHQRNKGIAAASSDWLLHMDIDERVPPELAREFLVAIVDDARDAYRFRRCNYFLHRPMRGGGWQDWNQVHLARRDKLRFAGMFHETCELSAPAARIGQLESTMLHFNEDGFAKRLRKSDQYLEELVETLRASGARPAYHSILLSTLAEFCKKYIYKKGFIDGVPGLILAIHGATAVFRAHVMVWDEQNSIPRGSLERALESQWEETDLDELKAIKGE